MSILASGFHLARRWGMMNYAVRRRCKATFHFTIQSIMLEPREAVDVLCTVRQMGPFKYGKAWPSSTPPPLTPPTSCNCQWHIKHSPPVILAFLI